MYSSNVRIRVQSRHVDAVAGIIERKDQDMQAVDRTASTTDIAVIASYIAEVRLAMSSIEQQLDNIWYVVGVPESERLA